MGLLVVCTVIWDMGVVCCALSFGMSFWACFSFFVYDAGGCSRIHPTWEAAMETAACFALTLRIATLLQAKALSV